MPKFGDNPPMLGQSIQPAQPAEQALQPTQPAQPEQPVNEVRECGGCKQLYPSDLATCPGCGTPSGVSYHVVEPVAEEPVVGEESLKF